jgi:predicted transport protein
MAKSPEEMLDSMVANLKEKTGKTLDEWIQTARKTKLAKHGEIVKYLKSEYGMGHGYANLVAQQALQGDQPAAGDDDLVAAQYTGAKAALKPVYDSLIAAVKKFGGDVEVAPKKTYVSLRRSKQFAIIQPSTATRLDVGINLKGTAPTDRLEASGSFNAMVSHRVRVGNAKEIDGKLLDWLRQAYEAS